MYGATKQPPPLKSDGPACWDLVINEAESIARVLRTPRRQAAVALAIEDMAERHAYGQREYGMALRANNGRDALVEWYQETLDAAVYARQAIEENPQVSELSYAFNRQLDLVFFIRGLLQDRDDGRATDAATTKLVDATKAAVVDALAHRKDPPK